MTTSETEEAVHTYQHATGLILFAHPKLDMKMRDFGVRRLANHYVKGESP